MTVEIRDLTFDCIIGMLDFERLTPQRVVIDAVIDYDYLPGTFLNYATVAERIRREMTAGAFELIEDALTHLGSVLKADFPAMKTLSLSITKPDILPDCRVSVSQKSIF